MCALSFTACGSEPSARAPRAPDPAMLLPRDADVVVRVDLARVRQELGAELTRSVSLTWLSEQAEQGAGALLGAALDRATLAWLALDLDGGGAPRRALLLRGHFATLDPEAAGFRASAPTRGLRSFELASGPHGGGALVRLHRVGDESAVFTDREGLREPKLTREAPLWPPDRGVISVAWSPRIVMGELERFPRIASYLGSAEAALAYADPSSTGLELQVELTYAEVEAAEAARQVVGGLLAALATNECAPGELARASSSARLDRVVSVEAHVDRERVARLYDCVLGGACCPGRASATTSATNTNQSAP